MRILKKNNLFSIIFILLFVAKFSSANAQLFVKNNSEIFVDSVVLYVDGNINLSSQNSMLYLRNEAQLIQSPQSNTNQGLGSISVYQEGTTNQFAYNYWCAPVGQNQMNNSINNSFKINMIHEPLLSTPNTTDSQLAQFTGGYNGSSNPLTIAKPWLYTFNNNGNATNNWNYAGDIGLINTGLGFTMKGTAGSNNNQTYDFRGKPNNGNISNIVLPLQFTLIGNPYPSALDTVAFLYDNDNINAITGTLYFWEQDLSVLSHVTTDYVGGYASYTITNDGAVETFTPAPFYTYNTNGTINTNGNASTSTSLKRVNRYLPIAQGFLVEGNANTSGMVTTKNQHRTFYKESGSESEFFKLNTNNNTTNSLLPSDYKRFRLNIDFDNTYTRQLVHTFHDDATEGFDYGLENKCLNILNKDSYWENNSVFFTSQALPFNIQLSIPLTVKLNSNSLVRFRLFDMQNFEANQLVFLFDNSNGMYYDLINDNLELNLIAGLYNNRFEIRFYNNTLSLEDEINQEKNLYIYYNKSLSQIIINNKSNLEIQEIELFDLSGKKVFSKKINSNINEIAIPLNHVTAAIYICTISYQEMEKNTQKLIIY
jgi:hypothetical protein